MLRVAIIGGYGNFGSHVARSLASNPDITLIIAGRSIAKAQSFAENVNAANSAESGVFDIAGPPEALAPLKPDLVINMVGPYNDQGYGVAEAAIACGAHYCDIADAREFVSGITRLDPAARAAGVSVFAGASSVPALTAAYLDEAATEMHSVTSVSCGISGAEQANRGAGTVAAVLSFVGRPFTELQNGEMVSVTGWSGLHRVGLPELGQRWFGRANVPDLDLFRARYPSLKSHSFWAGHEITLLHFGTALMGLFTRIGLLPRLDRFASSLVRISKLFNWLGNGRSGFFMHIGGEDRDGEPLTQSHYVIARQGHGPYIPCIPVIRIAQRLAQGEQFDSGARPCLGIVRLDEFREAKRELDVTWISR